MTVCGEKNMVDLGRGEGSSTLYMTGIISYSIIFLMKCAPKRTGT